MALHEVTAEDPHPVRAVSHPFAGSRDKPLTAASGQDEQGPLPAKGAPASSPRLIHHDAVGDSSFGGGGGGGQPLAAAAWHSKVDPITVKGNTAGPLPPTRTTMTTTAARRRTTRSDDVLAGKPRAAAAAATPNNKEKNDERARRGVLKQRSDDGAKPPASERQQQTLDAGGASFQPAATAGVGGGTAAEGESRGQGKGQGHGHGQGEGARCAPRRRHQGPPTRRLFEMAIDAAQGGGSRTPSRLQGDQSGAAAS